MKTSESGGLGPVGLQRAIFWQHLKHFVYQCIPGRLLADKRGHLRHARRQLLYLLGQRDLAMRNHIDQITLRESTLRDQYDLSIKHFQAADVIIDIGAHIGVFSYLCHQLGCRHLQAYEPDRGNFRQLHANIGHLEGVQAYDQAVFRSDRTSELQLIFSGYPADNNVLGNVVFGGSHWDVRTQTIADSGSIAQVNQIGLDKILAPLDRVRLLKLDCEGSEYAILLTATLLSKVQEIYLEYHEIPSSIANSMPAVARLDGFDAYGVDQLLAKLKAEGFLSVTKRLSAHHGMLHAWRKFNGTND
jgi:FkbM family methyltransferase